MKNVMKKLAAMLLCAAAMNSQQAPKRAPGFCLIDTTGQWHDLADYQGKIVVVEFMQSTCSHCAEFAPVMDGVAKKYAGKMQVLAIAVSSEMPPTQNTMRSMIQFASEHKITYPLMLDVGQVAQSYVRGPTLNFPTLYLVDAGGMLRGKWEYGSLAKDIFEGNGLSKEIDKLLAPAQPAKK